MQKITIERTTAPKAKPTDETKLGFGKIFTDHMFIMNYDEGEGWHNPRIVPYAPIALDPAAMCLHYGQADFEGLKAYRRADGSIGLFRPDQNMARLNVSNERLCIPKIDEAFGVEAIKTLVEVDKDWVPHSEGTSLYIRPYIFAIDPMVGVHPAKHLLFVIILSPVGAYDEGKFDEAFGSGTAAVISPIGELKYGDKHMVINDGKIGPISQKLYDTLTGIQWGRLPDEFGWTVKVD